MWTPALILTLGALSSATGSYGVSTLPGNAPPIAIVQQKAIEYARLEPSEISSWKKRARLSALLPKLQVSYDRRVKYNIDVDVSDSVYVGSQGSAIGPSQGSYAANEDLDHNIGVKAVWSLGDTVFNPDMLAVSEEARMLARERHAILAEVNKNYYERDKVTGEIQFLVERLKPKPRDEEIRRELLLKRVCLDEATAALDALTGGWFGKQIATDSGR